MTNGRNTSVISVRLPDEIKGQLKDMAKRRRKTMTELLQPVLLEYALRGGIRETHSRKKRELHNTDIEEEQLELERELDCWENPETKREVKYPGTGRNAPCPCGSGKKYKKCCGA